MAADLTPVTIDWEAFYGTGMSLKSVSYTDYITSPRFAETGCAIKVGDAPTVFYEPGNIDHAVRSIDWNNSVFIAHNVGFDGLILRLRYGISAARYFCTLAAARILFPAIKADLGSLVRNLGLPTVKDIGALESVKDLYWEDMTPQQQERLGHYCVGDVDNTYAAWQLMRNFLPQMQQDVMDVLFQCAMSSKLHVNLPFAREALEEAKQERRRIIKASGYTAKALGSNPQFAQILRDHGVEPPMKVSEKTEKETYAFAKKDLAFQELYADHPELRPILEAREACKSTLLISRLNRFIEAEEKCGFLPMLYKPFAAHTGRVGGDNKMNVANLPRKGPLRPSVTAPPGHAVVTVDSGQIECRLLHWQADSYDMLYLFATGQDPYRLRASKIYQTTPDEVDGIKRFVGKTTELGLGYGMGASKFRYTLAVGAMGPSVDISHTEAREIVFQWRADNWRITEGLWQTANDLWLPIIANGHGHARGKAVEITPLGIKLPNDLYLMYPNIRWTEDDEGRPQLVYDKGKRLYGGKVVENVTQALANIVIQEQMVAISKRYKVCMHTYDEVSCVVPISEADDCLAFMLEVMKTPPVWAPDLPLDAEGAWDTFYCK